MQTKRSKIIKIAAVLIIAGIIAAVGTVIYMFNMPHRDVQTASIDYRLTASELVAEYLNDSKASNDKFLSEDGDSKVMEVNGIVADISEDFSGQKVVLLKVPEDKAGVSCTFTPETNDQTNSLNIGDEVSIKGVIRQGASYNEDLGMYINVIIEKSSLIY